ncbi:MAG: TlpA family protein disulfide reductase [Methanosarcinales archaeon]
MMNKKVTKIILYSAFLIFIVLITGCVEQTPQQTDNETIDWKNFELTDVATGNKFKIRDFTGKPILMESFAVWCPTCLQQQKQIKELKSTEGASIVYISLDVDPNEDEDIIKDHFIRNGFDWYFAIAPPEFTRALIDEFGLKFVNAPAAPVVLICENQSTRFLGRGVKSADKLKSEIDRGC